MNKEKIVSMVSGRLSFILLVLLLCSCQSGFTGATPTPLPSLTATVTETATLTLTPTRTSTTTMTGTPTLTATVTQTSTITSTPTQTLTPTFDFPDGVVNVGQANCRYGPGKAYLYSHGLYEGDHVLVHGRNSGATWLWVKPDNLDRHCWAAASVFDIDGDVMRVTVPLVPLPMSSFVHPPTGIEVRRTDNQLNIRWDAANYIPEGDRRGYLLEVNVCQNGSFFWMALQTDDNAITIQDDADCTQTSNGLLYIAEKHGYSKPVSIPWQ